MPIVRKLTAENVAELQGRTIQACLFNEAEHSLHFRFSSDGTYGGHDNMIITEIHHTDMPKSDLFTDATVSKVITVKQDEGWDFTIITTDGATIRTKAGDITWTVSITH